MPQHKRGPWSQTEDQYLLHLVHAHGAHNWVRISSTIGTRSPKQCRERFHQNLKPNLNHDPITPEEGVRIEQMVAEMGKRWAEIARRLRGRSDNAVKNWWNGGMNRRRRSNNSRRTELEVRTSPQAAMQNPVSSSVQGAVMMPPFHSNIDMARHPFHGHSTYQATCAHVPQHITVPSFGAPFRHPSSIETPLPSPSAFSQISAEGAPSLVSDCSSTSARSPHNGTSPIELPPLSGSRQERRHSSARVLHLGVPGEFPADNDYHFPSMNMSRYEEASKQPPTFQEPFRSQHQMLRHPSEFHTQHYRQLSPFQHVQMPFQYPTSAYPLRRNQTFPPPSKVLSSSPQSLQLPSIATLSSNDGPSRSTSTLIDPALMQCSPQAMVLESTPGGSPKDKMSLSAITS